MTDHDAIRDRLASHTTDFAAGERLHRVRPHVTYAVEFEGRRAVCKVATHPEGDPATEARAMEHARRASDLPVPKVLAVGDDHFVAGWLDGLPGAADPTPAKVRTMGRGLARLHEATAGSFGATGPIAGRDGALAVDARSSWAETLAALLRRCRTFLRPYGHADAADEVLAFVRDHGDAFVGGGPPVLVHGNWLAEHVATADGRVRAVVDFEHALAGPAEWDYLRAVVPTFGPAGRGETDGTAAGRAAFRDAYESVRPLPTGHDRRLAASRPVLLATYLRSLYLQRLPSDGRAAVDERADRLRGALRERLAAARRRVRR